MKLARIALLTVVFFGCEKAPTERQEVKKAKEASPSTGKQADAKKLPEIALRGYGKVSGTFRETPPKDASLLELVCEDEAKAKLTQAKYLSDLVELPGVQATTVKTRQGPLNAWTAETQGLVAAIQIGNKVTIVAGKDEAALNRALAGSQADVAKRSSKAQVEVPMWLDRWDKFGFRFYYRAWETPPGTKPPSSYDITKEFEFAEKNDRSGFLFWANRNEMDTAEGLSQETYWDWALRESAAKKLPVSLNISSGGSSMGGTWFFNRYRDQMTSKMPQFCGAYYTVATPYFGGPGMLSWSATTAKDVDLGMLQDIVRKSIKYPNVTTILEPHGELRHGLHDIFVEYGPVADVGYRKFLQARYAELTALNTAWGTRFAKWEDVRVPEVASFLGWGPQALDLTGTWRVGYEKVSEETAKLINDNNHGILKSEKAPDEWFSKSFDDSSWPTVVAPGHDRTSFLPKRPAIYRQTFEVPSTWLAAHPKVWLYLWDLNLATGDTVKVVLNDQPVAQNTLVHTVPHWTAVDITQVIKEGKNQLSLRLPKGILCYRIYLSSADPKEYPNLGKEGNARWVDFADWIVDSRLAGVRSGMEMIRQVDPNRQIVLMAPGSYEDGVKRLAADYGGNFHNTGYMGAFFADNLPAIMRGARLPFCLEPGGPAHNLAEFKNMFGLYSVEGIQGLDYFIHIGDIMWNPEIRQYFEQNLQLVKLLGKYHAPKADVASLTSTRNNGLTGYPWGEDFSTNLGGGYWKWNVRAHLMGFYETDSLTESSFAEGDAARYRVVIDTNTSIMDEKLIAGIEKFVRDGGTFVTFVQTGRHTPTERDAWPISKLTGFRVTHIDALTSEGNPKEMRSMKPVIEAGVFSGDWSRCNANGLTLEAVSEDAKPLMQWTDGSTAVGLRKLGKGYIIQVGCKFRGKQMFDRVGPANVAQPTFEMRDPESKFVTRLLSQILDWQKISKVADRFVPENQNVVQRHYLSNNGLYDVWTLWNQSKSFPAVGDTVQTDWAWDIGRKEKVTLTGTVLPVSLEPLETKSFLTPRHAITTAPLAWFQLQCDWWRATKPVSATPLPLPPHRFSVDLNADWAFKSLGEDEDGAAFASSDVDASKWEKIAMGIWSLPNRKEIKHAIMRKSFTVPKEWGEGDARLSLKSWVGATFVDLGRIWLDGKLISDWRPDGLINVNPDGVLKPGSTHSLAVEIKSKGSLAGSKGQAWLWVWPKPDSTLDLAGEWLSSTDMLRYDQKSVLPGSYKAFGLRRELVIPANLAGKNVLLNVETTGGLTGALVNGTWVRRFHHHIGTRFDLNITPWVKFGQKNEIELVGMGGISAGNVQSVNLGFHDPKAYP